MGRVAVRVRPVARHLLLGWSNRQIAQELGLPQQTVRNYVKQIFDAAGAEDRDQARQMILGSARLLGEIYEKEIG